MIESRYSIEYIDPNSETTSSKLGKLLIYSVLAISIVIAIIALIFSNLPRSTSQGITAKVQNYISSFNTASVPSTMDDGTLEEEVIKNDDITPDIKTPTPQATATINKHEDKLVQQELITSKRETEFKNEIERLSQENTTQHNETVKQLEANKTLKEKLEQLSKKLKNEELKHSELAKTVSSLTEKNKSASAQLKEANQVAEKRANEIKKLEQKKKSNIETITPPLVVSTPVTPKVVEVEKTEEKVTIESATTKNTITAENEKPKISQMDAIVAAMEAANNTSSTKDTETTSASKKE